MDPAIHMLIKKRDEYKSEVRELTKAINDAVKDTQEYKNILDNTLRTCKDEKVAANHALKVFLNQG
jgi:prefoldin subunit 5